MRIGSLFSGAGGLDMAVEQVFGGRTVWHCEKDSAASKVLEHRYPGVPNHHNIIEVGWASVEPVDILCGGWPCQPFSLAGKRKGADDERALWPYVARAVRMVRPRYVVLENVSAVLGPEFLRVANDLAALGYDIAWKCLRASDVGAPHRRERFFAVATDADRGGFKVGPERDGEPSSGVAASQRGNVSGRRDDAGPVGLLPTPAAARSGRNRSQSAGAAIRPSLDSITSLLPTPRTTDSHGAGGPDLRTAISLLQTPSVADALGGHLSRSGARGNEALLPGQAKEMAGQQWGKYAVAVQRWEAVTRPAPPPTIPGRTGQPRLNPEFSSWLMGWPAGWVTDIPGISRNDALRIVGNGVCPQQAVLALRYLLAVSERAA